MREECRVEIHADLAASGPVDPALEKLRRQRVAVDDFAFGMLGIERVKVQAMGSGDEAEGFVEIGAEMIGRARFPGIISGDGEPAAELSAGGFEPADVIALPAMEADRNCAERGQGFFGVDAEVGVLLAREVV